MNRFISCSILSIYFFSFNASALDNDQIQKLGLLAKTWSAAKNFHSRTCQMNWDEALISAIPLIVNAENKEAFNLQINSLLDTLDTNQISNTNIPITPVEIRQTVDNSWTDAPEFLTATQNRLKTLINSFRPRNNCFVTSGPNGQGGYTGDNLYSDIQNPSKEVRLLAVFRFWNIINQYFPYKHLIDKPWDSVLTEFIPLIYDAETNLAYHRMMRILIAQIQDSHAFFSSDVFNNSFPNGHLPFRIKTIEGQVIIYKKTNLQDNVQIGDKVISINGVPVNILQSKNQLFTAASNPATLTRNSDFFYNIGQPGNVMIELQNSNDQKYSIQSTYGSFPADLYAQSSTKWSHMDRNNCTIGYVNMGQIEIQDISTMMRAFENKDAIIFDLRNYPNGTLWTLVNYLYTTRLFNARFALPNISYPGAYQWRNGTFGQGTSNPYQGRLIILFNEDTQSQSEYTVMGLEQHPNAVKIGSQTAAADGNVTSVKLPGQIEAYFTGMGVYYPDGQPTQRIGIIPDLFIRPSVKGVIEGKDEVLDRALNCEGIADLNWPEAPKPRSGLFWDPKKSGKGIDIAEVGQQFTVIPYDFRADGSPVWYLGVAQAQEGILNSPDEDFFEYKFDTANETIATITQTSDLIFDFKQGPFEIDCAVAAPENKSQMSRLLWKNATNEEYRCMEEFIFSDQDSNHQDYTGLWYGGEAENGWGISINTQGNQIIVIVYYYDQQGKASWVLGSTTLSTNSPMEITMRKFTGYCQGCDNTTVTSEVAGQLVMSLENASNNFQDNNWISLTTDSNHWDRVHMPIKMLSSPQ